MVVCDFHFKKVHFAQGEHEDKQDQCEPIFKPVRQTDAAFSLTGVGGSPSLIHSPGTVQLEPGSSGD